MAGLSYTDFLKNKDKPSTSGVGLSYAQFKVDKQKSIDTQVQRQDLISKGLPVSNNPKKANPSILGSIVRYPLKIAAEVGTNIVNMGQIATNNKTTKPFSGNYLGKVDGLGEFDVTKGFTPENMATAKKSIATGAEIASLIAGGGAIKNAAGQVVKQTVRKAGIQLAKEGAATSFIGSAGNQIRENGTINPMQLAQDTAIGTVAGPLIGLPIQKLTGGLLTKSQRLAQLEQNISPGTLLPPPPPGGLIGGNPTSGNPTSGNPAPTTSITPEIPNTPINTPEYQQKILNDSEIIGKNTEMPNTEKITLEDQSRQANDFIQQKGGIDNAIAHLETNQNLPGSLRPDALHSILVNEADKIARETGDSSLFARVIDLRDIPKTTGQNLNLNKLKNPGSAYYAVTNLLNELDKKQSMIVKMNRQGETNSIKDGLKKLIDEGKLDLKDIDITVSELICE